MPDDYGYPDDCGYYAESECCKLLPIFIAVRKVLNEWKHPATDVLAMDMVLSDLNNCYNEYQKRRLE